MHVLRSERERVLPLVPPPESAGHMTFVHSVLEGAMEGLVLVDTERDPRSALIATYSGFYFALGEPDLGLAAKALPALQGWKAAEPAALWAVTPGWASLLATCFPASARRTRDEFLPPEASPPEHPLPARCRVTTDLTEIAALYRKVMESLSGIPGETWLAETWGGAAAFAGKSFGCGIVREGALIALCAACATANQSNPPEAEIEIWTAPDARRGGLALATAAMFIRQCHERGMEAAWTCETANEPSRRLADRLGFRFLRQIEGYSLSEYTGS